MTFSQQVQKLCAEVSAEQALSLGEFIVHLNERAETNPGVWNTSVSTLMQEASDEGFDAANLLATLQQLAKAAVSDEDQGRFAAELEKLLAGNASISEITAEISSGYPSLKAKMLELVEAAKAETRSLTGVAGGTSHNGDFKKTWQKTPNATKKQKWEKYGIDALEIFAGLSLVNFGAYTYCEKKSGGQILEAMKTDKTSFGRIDGEFITGEVRYRKALGMVVMDRKFDNWYGKGGRINFEINRFMPGGVIRGLRQSKAQFDATVEEKAKEALASHRNTRESFRTTVSSELESHEQEIESEVGDIDVTRLERKLERDSSEIEESYNSIINRNSPSVKTHPDLRDLWGSVVRPGSFALDDLESDAVEGAKQLGGDVERAVITDTTSLVEAADNIEDI